MDNRIFNVMRLTNCKEIIEENTHHDYDYRESERSLFNIFFPFSVPDTFYSHVLSESVMCADLTFPLLDKSHPTLKVYIANYIYNMDTSVRLGHVLFSKAIYKRNNDEFIPKKEIDHAIGIILGENRLDAYLTSYNRDGSVLETICIPQPYITMDMMDDAPVLTLTSLY